MHKKRAKKSMEHTHHKTIEDKLVENMIELQKIHAHMAEKFDKLANQISSLLALFEISAKSIAAANSNLGVTDKDKDFLNKIDKLLEQNKLIAKGLTLVEGKVREKLYGNAPAPALMPTQISQPPMISQGPSVSSFQQNNEEELSDTQPLTASMKVPEVPKPLPKY